MNNLKIGCSPLTAKIYAGKINNDGIWMQGKHDVTENAVSAVAQRLLLTGKKEQFEYRGHIYELNIEHVKKVD